eukprot:4687776-Amphidinium_carterae.1
MTQSRVIESVENFMTFERKSGESSDSMIVRFEETYRRSNREGGVVLNAVAMSCLLTLVVGVKTDELLVLINNFNGALPSNELSTGASLSYAEGTCRGKIALWKEKRHFTLQATDTQRDLSIQRGEPLKRSTGMRTKCGSTMRNKCGTDKAQTSSTVRKKTK